MPDTRRRRGPAPKDAELFSAGQAPALRRAVADLSWLRSHGYSETAAMKLVGDRFRLTARQRTAVGRSACSDAARESRRKREILPEAARDRALRIDGFNLLISIESALAGGVLLRGRDGCLRDMSSLHGNYRLLADTEAALSLAHRALDRIRPAEVTWYLDAPVSNSGRLKSVIEEIAADFPAWNTAVQLVKDPDPILARVTGAALVASADSAVLDACGDWINLAGFVVSGWAGDAWILDLGDDE